MTTQNVSLAAAQKLEAIHLHARSLLGMIEQLAAFAPSRGLSIIKTHAETAMLFAKEEENKLRAEFNGTATAAEQEVEQVKETIEPQVEHIEEHVEQVTDQVEDQLEPQEPQGEVAGEENGQ